MQPVGGEHALTVEHPGSCRSERRTRRGGPPMTASNPGVTVNDGSVPPAWTLRGQRFVRFERLHLAGLRHPVPHLAVDGDGRAPPRRLRGCEA